MPKTVTKSITELKDPSINLFIIQVTNIGANLIAIISFVAFINAVLQWFGSLVGADYLTFEFVLGKIFVPISWLMGVENNVSELIEIKLPMKN
jgi:pyrimidine nucleoside transport protein